VAQQYTHAGTRHSGRLADVRPALHQVAERPLTGRGFGVTDKNATNAQIYDDGYLSRMVDTGVLGFAALLLLLAGPTRVLSRFARRVGTGEASDLAAALACSMAGYAVAFALFDGLSFFQPLLTFMIFLAVGGFVVDCWVRDDSGAVLPRVDIWTAHVLAPVPTPSAEVPAAPPPPPPADTGAPLAPGGPVREEGRGWRGKQARRRPNRTRITRATGARWQRKLTDARRAKRSKRRPKRD
jgi:hypothetical protein